jgi:4-oxalocrotonate tautomerase
MPPAKSRKSQTIRHATRPYSVEVGVVGASRMVVRGVLRLIAKLTDAICEVIGEDIRSHTWVLVEGLSPKQWGVGGKPTDVSQTTQATV